MPPPARLTLDFNKDIHIYKKLKEHIGKTYWNMSTFTKAAILEKIEKEKIK